MAIDFISAAVANAKKALAKANKDVPTPTAQASYSLARKARKSSGIDYNPIHTVKTVVDVFKHPEGSDIASGLKSASNNVNEYAKSSKSEK